MSYTIRCHILFDVTQTGISNRQRQNTNNLDGWILKRNTQCNLDTVLQTISLRSLPEVYQNPTITTISLPNKRFGSAYKKERVSCWMFDFQVSSIEVFDNGESKLGLLYTDCSEVPMILCGTESKQLNNSIDITPQKRNIYFEVLSNET